MAETCTPSTRFSRRRLLGAAAAAPLLAACGKSSSSNAGGGGTLKFWDMPWAEPPYGNVARKLVTGYKPPSGLPAATYQEVQWSNFTEVFASAIASNTGPAVSSGGAFQAFQFAKQGKIAYADDLIDTFRKDGTIDDFLPGLVDALKTPEGYVAVPWLLDPRVFWMRKSLLAEAGVSEPRTWDEFTTACAALKKIGIYGYATGAGPGNNLGNQGLVAMMVNNGGGLFDPDGKLDTTYVRNVEAIDFVINLVKEGYIDPSSVSYTPQNQATQWKKKKFAMGIDGAGLAENVGDTSGDLFPMSPMAGPHGDKGGLIGENNLMMYTNTPTQKGSEAFLEFYIKNMKIYWESNLSTGLPALKSIVALPTFQANKSRVKIIEEWQPISKSLGFRQPALSAKIGDIDSSAPLIQFGQRVLAGKSTGIEALTILQNGLKPLIKS